MVNESRHVAVSGLLRLIRFGVAGLIVIMPFHAFITAWLSSNFGFFDEIRLWKEAVLAILALLTLVYVAQNKPLRRELKQSSLVRLTLVLLAFFASLAVIGIVAGGVNIEAAGYGLVIDSRSFVFLLIVLVTFHHPPFKAKWRNYILIPAAIVIGFGLTQPFLPNNFLRHFGYGPDTIAAFQTVDNKPELVRTQSFLRGPNPLGAYLVPVILLLIASIASSKKRRALSILGIVAALTVLFTSYSRSAWLGLIVGASLLVYWLAKGRHYRRLVAIISAGLLIVLTSVVVLLRNNNTVQNLVFHTNELSSSPASSNRQRAKALRDGVKSIYKQPLGGGVGSAGPASLRNTKRTARVSENFFIQIGQEAGVIGLGLLLGVLAVMVRRLWGRRSDPMALAVLASLAGLMVINFISHAWADDTLAYVFFGMAGTALGVKTSTKSEKGATIKQKQ